MTRQRTCLVVFLVFLLTAHCPLPTALGQSATATLSGTVVDQNGAAVPGTAITVLNTATSLQRQATSNDEGYFTVPLLSPGTYMVSARRDGFAPLEIPNVVLNVGDQKALQIQLKAGDINATVQVINEAELINESPAVGTVVDRQFVANLPLNGRSFQSLITLTPGVVLTKASAGSQGQFSVNGQRASANYFTVDGVSANIGISTVFPIGQTGAGALPGFSALGSTNNLVSVDALQEFKIQTSTYAAEFGRSPGGQVQILTRSGTNDFHGTVFEYFRNDALDANDWFANSRGLPKPPLRQNDFGGVLGGPIIKNRTFFFFSYEGLRLRQPQTAITIVPSLQTRQTVSVQLQPFLNAFPVPNGRDLGGGVSEFNASFSNPSTLNATSIRLDHTLHQKLTFFGRYNYAPSETIQRGAPFAVNTLILTPVKIQTLTGGATWAITPNVSNEVRINYSRSRGRSFYEQDDFGGAVPVSDSVLFPTPTTRQGALFFFGIFRPSVMEYQIGLNVENLQRQINLVDNLSLVSGPHQLKIGVDYRRLTPITFPAPYRQFGGFTGIGVTTPGVPPPVGTVLSGRALFAAILSIDSVGLVFNNLSAYGEDTWRVSPRLTLTYGLRWEVNPAPSGTGGKELFTVQGLENPATITLAPEGTPLYQTTYSNFAPRVGLAYQLSRRQGRETVLKGGFGIFYDLGSGEAASANINWPYERIRSLPFGTLFPLDPASAAPIPFTTKPPVGEITAFEPNLKLPRTYQWNLSLERSLGGNQTISASYVAAIGRRLLRVDTLSNPNPNFVSFLRVTRNSATSDYHAMQLQFRRRLSRGLQALASYTWSHSIDIASNDTFATFSDLPIDKTNPNRDRGPSDFDIRHAFNAAITYKIPTAFARRLAAIMLNKWSVDTIISARSATPVNVLLASRLFTGVGFVSPRPDLITGVPLYLSDPSAPGGRRFNPDAFSANFSGRQGTLGRNALRGFPAWQVDLALGRQFNLTEKVNLEFRAEFFNIFNHPNFADPNNTFPGITFGRSTQMLGRGLGVGESNGGLNPLYQVGGPRSIQLALKLNF